MLARTWQRIPGFDDSDQVKLQRIWAQGDYKNFSVQLGKFPDVTNYDKALMLNDQMSGAAVTFGNKLQATVMAGRIDITDRPGYCGKR
jgi:hypothetical protein